MERNPDHQEAAINKDELENDLQNPTERTLLLVVKTSPTTPVTKSYTIRWFVLVVFTLNTAASNVIWASILPISALAACYYGVGLGWINALTLCFFVTYILLFAPAAKFLENFGIRSAVIVTACLNSAGAWLRFSGSGFNLFWLMLVGQTIASVGCVIMWTGPSLLSSVWFPPSERAIATAISGAIAPQIGLLLGTPFGPFIVHSPDTFTICNTSDPLPRSSPTFIDWEAKIYQQLLYYQLAQAILISLLIPLSFCVPAVPSVPPSLSKQLQGRMKKTSIVRSVLDLLKNPYYVMLNIAFLLFVAVSSVFNTIIEELLVTTGYESYQDSMGYLGIIVAITNVIGVLITGIWLSYSKTYYFTGLLLSAVYIMFAIGFTIAIQLKWNFYLVAVLYSFAQMGGMSFQGFAYEYAVEMTYPQPESISAALLNAASQFFGIILLYAVLPMIVPSLAVYCSWLLTGLVVIGSFIMVFTRPKLRRIEIDT